MTRKEFIALTIPGIPCLFPTQNCLLPAQGDYVMTVSGKVNTKDLKITLPHEHIATDFSGAETVAQPQYLQADAIGTVLPSLLRLKEQGVSMLVECTPNYIGRDVQLLKKLSAASGLYIVTNTGYYAAAAQKYLPRHAYVEDATSLAARFIKEWEEGIGDRGIRPGFIKLGVDGGPLKEVEQKLIRAGAGAHLRTGLKIAIHTGSAAAAAEEFSILTAAGIAPEGFIWVHAQNDTHGDEQVALAKKGCWISLDGISQRSIAETGKQLQRLKAEGLLGQVLLSHDDGWAVNKKSANEKATLDLFDNGNIAPYQTVFSSFRPYLLEKGFTENELRILMVENPKKALAVKICRL